MGETIFALSSGSVPAGVAVVRLSGQHVRFALETLMDSVPEPRRATLRLLRGGDGSAIDRGIVLYFPGPGSVTGEDVAELHLHGGRAVVAAILGHVGALAGLRPAEPGEFTRRAFLNGRMDLTEVEGLADLISAETEAQRRQAMRQASGSLRGVFDDWRERLVRARALVEAELEVYAPLVPVGCYVIVEDSNIGRIRKDLLPGPFEAVEAFMRRSNEFEIDLEREKFLITFNPSGYLRRVR